MVEAVTWHEATKVGARKYTMVGLLPMLICLVKWGDGEREYQAKKGPKFRLARLSALLQLLIGGIDDPFHAFKREHRAENEQLSNMEKLFFRKIHPQRDV